MRKRLLCIVIVTMLSMVGCNFNDVQMEKDYSLCNDTSRDNMAEIESGFFYIFNEILYYADKENMAKWIPVCNKPDCLHKDKDCNAYIGTEIAQKGETLYCISDEVFATGLSSKYRIFVNEILTDGSGLKKIYEIPFEDGVVPSAYRALISSNSLILYYRYLAEDGLYQNCIARLEEDGRLYHLFSEKTEEQTSSLMLSSSVAFVRGKEGIISENLTLAYTNKTGVDIQNVLWNVDGEKPEMVPIPENVSFSWCYLSDDYMIDYEGREGYEKGYYKYDFSTGEKLLLGKAEQENAWGYIMTENCVVESNRYLGQTPDEPYLKIYYNGKWSYVVLPDIISKASEETSFAPIAIASDRIFFVQDANGSEGYSSRLYYVMLNDETPELTYCTTFGSDSYFNISNIEQSKEDFQSEWQELDNIIFDTEEYLLKVTGIRLVSKEEDYYEITMYCENKNPEESVYFVLQNGAINGVYACFPQNISLDIGESSKECSIYVNKTYSEVYSLEEFMDISFLVYDIDNSKIQKEVHVYPRGKENAIHYIRERQSTDIVLVDNEYVTVTIIGYENNSIQNDTVKLYIENKSDTNVAWMREKFSRINGEVAKQYRQEGNVKYILVTEGLTKILPPNVCAYESLELPREFLQENGVTTIENFDVLLKIWYGETWDNELINDTFTITP